MRGSFGPLRESQRIFAEWRAEAIASLERSDLIVDETNDPVIEKVHLEGDHLLLHSIVHGEAVHYQIPIFKGEEGEPSDELLVLLGEEVREMSNTSQIMRSLIGKNIPT